MTGDSADDRHERVRAFLARPETFGLADDEHIETVETHGSVVFLANKRAYKLKKPVKFPYMDFSTQAKRIAAARTELAINRRFNDRLYLGLAAVVMRDGRFTLTQPADDLDGIDGDLIEPLVVMERFPESARLDHLTARGDLDAPLADRLGVMVAELLEKSERRESDWAASLGDVIEESLTELDERPDLFAAERVNRLRQGLNSWLQDHHDLLQERARNGHLRRCHGDLHLRNLVYLDGRPQPFDALEFDDALATTDTIYDLAFLVMDLLYRGEVQAAARVIAVCLVMIEDFAGVGLLNAYAALRAVIRAKVAASQQAAAQDNTNAEEDELANEAVAYLRLADQLLAPAAPRLIAIGGLSGAGKTSAAFALAPKLPTLPLVLRSDVLRKAAAGADPFARLPEEAYTPDRSRQVYADMYRAAGEALGSGATVILDAVFNDPESRAAAENLARDHAVPFSGFWLDAGRDERISRVQQRTDDASDADATIAKRQEAKDAIIGWHRIDAGGSLSATLRQLEEALPAVSSPG